MLGALLLAAGCDGHSVDDLGATLAVTVRASVGAAGAESNGPSSLEFMTLFTRKSVSADGRYVAFQSDATNLVPINLGGFTNVFVFDRLSGTTVLASVPPAGGAFAGPSACPAISADGRYVVFQTDEGFPIVIYRRDLQSGQTVQVSLNTSDANPDDGCYNPCISGDGRYVTFQSSAFDLIANPPGNIFFDVYRRDMTVAPSAGGNELVNFDAGGSEPSVDSGWATISADGRYVAFETWADIDAGDNNGAWDIYVRDMNATAAAGLVRVSADLAIGDSNGDSHGASISADGNWVAFESFATNLVAGDANSLRDVFLASRTGGPIRRVSVHSSGAEAQGGAGSLNASVSGDGRFVAFQSNSVNLVDDDTNQATDIFIHDTRTGTTARVSVRTFGAQTGLFQDSTFPAISDDGRFVAFDSKASNLVDGDSNGVQDVFLRGPLR
jgi:Tol biopolymer transport system component